ncbi:hypothetical protein U9M48_042415 [Paspalum notatum var. saurae]|uniref:Leucine-rich repeat-containing N-terminal plant-type domain-containing protein n=1 Tax=Paspalum notatum var. saurae TaxID=547442 RepID=A0AAQ3UUR9_PASNO
MRTCGGAVKRVLNSWGLSQRSIKLKTSHFKHRFQGKIKIRKGCRVVFPGTAEVTSVQRIMCCSKKPAKLAMHMPILLPLLLLYYGPGSIHCSTVHKNSIDLQALLGFKQGRTRDPNGALSNWNMSSTFVSGMVSSAPRRHHCASHTSSSTVKNCRAKSAPLLAILPFLNILISPLTTLLVHLQQLLILYLYNKKLSGNISDALTNCSNLTVLDLSSNLLVGSIPPKLGILSKLEYLNLQSNQLKGSIPGELGQLKLQTLILSNNRLSGEIPQPSFVFLL